jgi:hypothetical protein
MCVCVLLLLLASFAADATAPEHALDLVLAGRTYVLVPQPATLEERQAWVSVWAQTLPVDAIAPALRPGNSFTAVDAPASGASAMDVDRFGAYEVPRVLMQGYMFKLPVRGGHRSTMSDLGGLLAGSGLPELAGWKRRFFLLRSGLLQWYRDDPANGESEFLGVLRLTPDTKVELEPEHVDARLKVMSQRSHLPSFPLCAVLRAQCTLRIVAPRAHARGGRGGTGDEW